MGAITVACLVLLAGQLSIGIDISSEHVEDLLTMTNRKVRSLLEVREAPVYANCTPQYKKRVYPEVLEAGIRSVVFETASAELSKRFNLTKREADKVLIKRAPPRAEFNANTICTRTISGCNAQSKYRTADGSCNNLARPTEGMAIIRMDRMLQAVYNDGQRTFRRSVTGEELLSPRIISLIVHQERNINHNFATNMIVGYGQFLDHDITSTPEFQNLQCCQESNNAECMHIAVPSNDDFYAQFGIRCLEIARSIPSCGSGRREQINQATAFIDGSQIYGQSDTEQRNLRSMVNGQLRTDTGNSRSLPKNPNAPNCGQPQNGITCFAAGDARLNENPGLLSLHFIFLREHNRIATGLRNINPGWNDETLYQETRRIVVAELQQVTYGEYLPVVVGPAAMNQFVLNLPSTTGGTTFYDANARPNIFNSFATAAYRFGHTQIPNTYSMGGTSSFQLETSFQNPQVMYANEGNVDRIAMGMAQQAAMDYDIFIASAVRNHLFQRPGVQFGSDLAAINIQRGRDHGIPPYNQFRVACGLSRLTNFDDLLAVTRDPEFVDRMKRSYRDVNDIDLWPGGIAEWPVDSGIVGPTFACIIGRQFNRLFWGDRFFFTHQDQAGSFTQTQRSNLRMRTLNSIICDNTFPTVTSLPQNAFLQGGAAINCANQPKLNLNNWRV